MITDNDIKKLKQTFVSKNDLKKELNRFATKEDIDQLELNTGKGFNDVQKQLSNVKADISEIKEEITEIKEEITEIKNNMLTMQDNILGAINKLQTENMITASYRPKIQNHEERITKLERATLSN